MPPKINRRRAVSVLSKIDEILSWERATGRGQTGSLKAPDPEGNGTAENPLYQGLQEPVACH